MSVIMKKGGEGFGLKAAVIGATAENQALALNSMYRGIAEFCVAEYGNYCDPRSTIIIRWTADDVGVLDLPECRCFTTNCLFSDDYKGNLRIIRLPKCIKEVDLSHMDPRAKRLSRLILRPGTRLITRGPNKIMLEKDEGGFVTIDSEEKNNGYYNQMWISAF